MMDCSPPVLCPWDSPSKNTGVFPLLQGIFLTQELNPGLLHGRWILYRLSHQGRPRHARNWSQRPKPPRDRQPPQQEQGPPLMSSYCVLGSGVLDTRLTGTHRTRTATLTRRRHHAIQDLQAGDSEGLRPCPPPAGEPDPSCHN